jgi:glycosyltransferase involved in cell wall biosynthesis
MQVDRFDWPYKSRIKRILGPISSFFKLSEICRTHDIIHVQYHIGEYGPLFLPIMGIIKGKSKLVLTLHEIHKEHPCIKRLSEWSYRYADLLFVHTKEHRQEVPQAKIIPFGIRKISEGRIKGSRTEVLIPGFINRWKGHDVGINALEGMSIHLTILGKSYDEDYFKEIQALAAGKDWITIKEGFASSEEYDRAFREADLILLPYRKITMSAVLADAVAYHKPMVASDIPAFREYLGGIVPLAEPGNAEDFADKIRSALHDEDMVTRLNDLAQSNSWKNVARKTMGCYSEVMNEKK